VAAQTAKTAEHPLLYGMDRNETLIVELKI